MYKASIKSAWRYFVPSVQCSVSMAQQLLLLLLLLTVASVFSTIAAAPTPYWTDQWAVHIPAGKGRRNFIQQDGSL